MSALPREPFWMVYGVGQREPTRQHLSREQADTEAKRLARAYPGIAFVVLQAVCAVIKQDLQTVTFSASQRGAALDDDQIPF